MNSRIAKTLTAIAATFAAMCACGDVTYSTIETVTFDAMNESPGKVFVGNSDETTFASDWVVFRSSDGSTNYGFTGASQFQVGSTDGHATKLGRLKIESGYYGANVVWKNLIGYKGTGYVWLTGGFLDVTNNLCVGVGGAGSVGYLDIDGGKVAISTDLNLPRDASSEGHASVTNGELAVSGNIIVCDGNNSVGSLSVGRGAMVTANKFWVARSSGSTAVLEVGGGTIAVNSEFNIANYGGNGTFVMTGGTIASKGSSYWGTDTGSTSTAEISGGSLTLGDGNHEFIILNDANSTCTITVNGGEVVSDGDVKFGNGGTTEGPGLAMLTISNGGYFGCGAEMRAKWFKFGEGGEGCARTININEGGVLGVWHFENYEKGTTTINFNGGMLKALGTDDNFNKYILGSHDHGDGSVTVTVNAKGGILDTNGKYIRIKNVVIGGEGTLKIVGGGSVKFEAKPTCPVMVEDGVLVGNEYTPDTIIFGANGFVKYDLSAVSATTEEEVTTLPGAQTLATGVTLTIPAGETVAEHVIIKNDGNLAWTASYVGSALTANPEFASETTANVTVWTGEVSDSWAGSGSDYGKFTTTVQNWTSGVMNSTKKVVVPFADSLYLGVCGVNQCAEMVLKTSGDVRIFNRSQHRSNAQWNDIVFRAGRISGDGTLCFGGVGIDTSSAGPACTIDVPVVFEKWTHYLGSGAYDADWTAYLKGASATYPLTVNKKVTVPSGVTGRIEANVFLNGDLEVGGTLTFNTTQNLQGAIAGGGTINGSFATAEGACVCAAITNANGTAECLTVTGNADLSNADVEILGGELLAEAADVTEILLLKASGTITWTKKSYDIPGQSKTWTIKTDTWTDEETSTTYNILKAVKSKPGFVIIVQ